MISRDRFAFWWKEARSVGGEGGGVRAERGGCFLRPEWTLRSGCFLGRVFGDGVVVVLVGWREVLGLVGECGDVLLPVARRDISVVVAWRCFFISGECRDVLVSGVRREALASVASRDVSIMIASSDVLVVGECRDVLVAVAHRDVSVLVLCRDMCDSDVLGLERVGGKEAGGEESGVEDVVFSLSTPFPLRSLPRPSTACFSSSTVSSRCFSSLRTLSSCSRHSFTHLFSSLRFLFSSIFSRSFSRFIRSLCSKIGLTSSSSFRNAMRAQWPLTSLYSFWMTCFPSSVRCAVSRRPSSESESEPASQGAFRLRGCAKLLLRPPHLCLAYSEPPEDRYGGSVILLLLLVSPGFLSSPNCILSSAFRASRFCLMGSVSQRSQYELR